MIKFFRKIRQNLLSEGKTGKYFKYAIGEIILVVIGILIALQINNWNENQKVTKEEGKIIESLSLELTDIHSELKSITADNLEFYELNVSISDSLKKGYSEFNERDLVYALNYKAYTIRNPALKNILGSNNKLPNITEELIRQLRNIHIKIEGANKLEFYLDDIWNNRITTFTISAGIGYDGVRSQKSLVTLEELEQVGYSKNQILALFDLHRTLLLSWIKQQENIMEITNQLILVLKDISSK
jgi:hypothetical protein